jgi:hypothetical protein
VPTSFGLKIMWRRPCNDTEILGADLSYFGFILASTEPSEDLEFKIVSLKAYTVLDISFAKGLNYRKKYPKP